MRDHKRAIYMLLFFYFIALNDTTATNDDRRICTTDPNDLQSVLSELERISSSLKSIGSINSKLISNLRNNAIHINLKSKKSEEIIKLGYTCTCRIGCHKLFLSNLTWNEARKSCRKDEARLAIINSETEAEMLKNLLLENHQFSAYVGIHNQFKDEWVTVFGEPLTETGYNRWSAGPPKISEANCGVLFEDGKLLGIPCQVERSYFCEISGMATCRE